MPSASLTHWQADRLPRLRSADSHAAAVAASPPDPFLADELLRGLVVLTSAHFQGYCRDLYTEAAAVVASKTRPSLRAVVQRQFTSSIALNYGNPNLANIRADFDRFGFALDLAADPANAVRLQHLAELNRWRNIYAHAGQLPTTPPPTPATARGWIGSCDGLAVSLDRLVYNELRKLLRRKPWPP
ncbi:MAG: hypothetical protein K2X82_08135 [Gemmataceae bacterium]|nr:hypothetical protein [Gemmataceae bacterium]